MTRQEIRNVAIAAIAAFREWLDDDLIAEDEADRCERLSVAEVVETFAPDGI